MESFAILVFVIILAITLEHPLRLIKQYLPNAAVVWGLLAVLMAGLNYRYRGSIFNALTGGEKAMHGFENLAHHLGKTAEI